MRVDNNGDLAAFLALKQLLMGKLPENKPHSEAGEAAGNDLVAPSRHNILQLVAAENLLAAESSLPDLEAAIEAAGRARGKLVSSPASGVKGQANIAPGSVLDLLQ
ncbi:MAG: hypothetical protein E3J72_01650 [Planctomycetota bacterium]|nr:MAG: hypothetical protein E3J72_01650 [Planctomycetota bacterium]